MRLHAPLFILVNTATALTAPTNHPLSHHTVYQFPKPTWVENIAIRPSDALLLTLLTSPTLQTIPFPTSPKPVDLPVYTFPNATGQTGIAPLTPFCDAYIALAGDANDPVGSFSAYTVSFSNNTKNTTPKIKKVAALTKSGLPNGIVTVSEGHAALIADSFLGLIWRLDIATGNYTVAIQIPETAAPPGLPPGTIAVNGLKISHEDGYLYFSNSATVAIYRIRIDKDGYPRGKAETVARLNASFVDDFAIRNGVIWATTNSDNRVFAVDVKTGRNVVVLDVLGPTSAAFGRGREDRHVLYVVTNGGLREFPDNPPEGGKVVALDTRGFRG
ncbi:hypothetical protein B0T16DRAFT_395934 [Cercophora newfieldiana]|uniref:SMP-30/Gluconolactonase/LRE-like region domain-containing protein n=1 Tax=Cercophora newfieldiana TaxID=92897 RepID=A0AA40CZN1_9PEZI|nr:hypothetical protein B0T16DRAFT_395934 [Cercophora newfieldiana]